MPADVATISQVDGLVSVKIDDYDRERRLNAPTSTAVAIPETDYISDIFIKGSLLVVGSKLIYTVIFCVSGANPVGALSTMAITAGQMYLLRVVMSPKADQQIKRFKNVAYEKIVGPKPATWSQTLLDCATIGGCLIITTLTFFITNKIETHWTARAAALAGIASAAGITKAALIDDEKAVQAEIPDMSDWTCERIINQLSTSRLGRHLQNADPTRNIQEQIETRPGEIFLLILGDTKETSTIFQNPPLVVIEKVQHNPKVRITRIPD
jgi:hypothetical protein